MRVELNIPDRAWAQVLQVAEENHSTVASVVEAAIRDAIRPSSMAKLEAAARKHRVLQAWGEGLTDAAIAERTGELKQYVANVRRKANLPPNMLRGEKYQYERKTNG